MGLESRIQEAVGDTYRLQRELGGGMSRVFLAEETRLSRQVLGKVTDAEAMLRQAEATLPEGFQKTIPYRHMAYGAVAEAAGRHEQAIAAYRRMMAGEGHCRTCGALQMAESYDRLGQPDSALAYYAAVVDTPTLDGARFVDSYALPPALKRLGELYEARADRKRAAEYYGRFVELWKEADPELQPAVREVRTRLAQLVQEPDA